MIKGKYELCNKGMFFFGIIQALNDFVLQLLMYEDSQINEWTNYFKKKLGRDLLIIIEYVPNMNILFELDKSLIFESEEKKNEKFCRAIEKFFTCFSELNIAVIIFLDNLQWADSYTNILLKELAINDQIRKVMIIFSCCDDEKIIGESNNSLFNVKNVNAEIIRIRPLTLDETIKYVYGVFDYKLIDNKIIAYHLFRKTCGNLSMINKVITKLEKNNLVSYIKETDNYYIEQDQIEKLEIEENLEIYLRIEINKLSSDCFKLLKFLAGYENSITIDSIKEIFTTEKNYQEIECLIIDLNRKGLIVPSLNYNNSIEVVNLMVCKIILSMSFNFEESDLLKKKLEWLNNTAQYDEAQSIVVEVLSKIDVEMPLYPNNKEIKEAKNELLKLLEITPIEKVIELSKIEDKHIVYILELLVSLCISSCNTNRKLFEISLMKMICINIKYGNSIYTPLIVAGYEILNKNFLYGFMSLKNINSQITKLNNIYSSNLIDCILNFLMGTVISYKSQSLIESISFLDKVIKYSFSPENVMFKGYSIIYKMKLTFLMGEPIDSVIEIGNEFRSFAMKYQFKPLIMNIEIYKHFAGYLKYGDIINLKALSMEENIISGMEFSYYMNKAQMYYFTSFYCEAEAMIEIGKHFLNSNISYHMTREFYFYEGIIVSKNYEKKSFREKKRTLIKLSKIIECYADLSDGCEESIKGKELLLIGIRYKLTYDYNQAIDYFNKALLALEGYPNYQYKAVALDLLGDLFEEKNIKTNAIESWKKSIICYEKWGSLECIKRITIKIDNPNMKEEIEHYANLEKGNEGASKLDLEFIFDSIFKEKDINKGVSDTVNQIYKHIKPETLTIIINHNNGFYTLANKNKSDTSIFLNPKLIENSKDWPIKFFRIVSRYKTYMMYNYKCPEGLASEMYFANNDICYAYCFPIFKENLVIGVFYLEYIDHIKLDPNTIVCLKLFCSQLGYSKLIGNSLKAVDINSKNNLLNQLTKKEKIILKTMVDGKTNKEIGEILFVSENTIKTHLKNIFRKLDVNRRIQVINLAKEFFSP